MEKFDVKFEPSNEEGPEGWATLGGFDGHEHIWREFRFDIVASIAEWCRHGGVGLLT